MRECRQNPAPIFVPVGYIVSSLVDSDFSTGYQKQVAPAYYLLNKQVSLAFGRQ
jgi:hypothetical protein